MTVQQVRDNFVQSLAENAYLNMCTVEEMIIVIESLEKQIPKKPCLEDQFIDKSEEWHKQYGISWKVYRCPACDWSTVISTITREPYRPNHCKNCGQALDWEGY